jgi:diguanylate cyclase (GGDEF)-like protein/PAS domain S-box-containing protein
MDQSSILEELSRINNELITSKRELARLTIELEEGKRFAERVLALTPDLVYVYDLDRGTMEFTNRVLGDSLGYSPERLAAAGKDFLAQTIHPEDRPSLREHGILLARARDGEVLVNEYRIRDARGEWRWSRSRETIFTRHPDGTPHSKLGIAEDITLEKEREVLLRQLSLVDELTGLKNRRNFEILAEQQIKLVMRTGSKFVLLYLDLDRFKNINDGFGHKEGDLALCEAAGLLRESFRSSDIIARLGGDEFAVLLVDTDEAQSRTLLARLNAAVDRRNAKTSRPYELVFSIGMSACRNPDHCDLAWLIATADEMMYRDKATHRSA